MRFENKTALVTGASRGIGRAIAEKLAQEGARVAVNYHSSKDDAEAVVAHIEKQGGSAFAVQGDVSQLDDIAQVLATVKSEFGALDILVNNAGTGEFVSFAQATPSHFDKQFNLNVRGLFFLTQGALEIMNDGGRVINISSISSRGLGSEGAAYGATKAAVNALSFALAKGVGKRGITINAVSPGLVKTDLSRSSFSDDDIARMESAATLGRSGQPEDIADIVAFLASDAARWITGREIVADGGTID